MDFVFDIDKTVAAAGYLTKICNPAVTIFVLLKMMYGAERDALAQWHRPITGDSFASLPKGPILSRTYNLLKGEIPNSNSDAVKWSAHFAPRVGNVVSLVSDPDFSFLSQREIDALRKSAENIAGLIQKEGKIAGTLHKMWPEWQDPTKFGRKGIPLSLRDVLSEVLDDESDLEKTILEIQAVSSAKAALQVA